MNELQKVCQEHDLELVILFGSRATGTARPGSDYDLGVLKREGTVGAGELFDLARDLSQALEVNDVDLVDLRHASPVLKYDAARVGRPLYEAEPGSFTRFHVLAWKLYQDDHYDLRRLDREYVQKAVLESFGRLLFDAG